MSEGNGPNETFPVESKAECGSASRTTDIDADQDHVNLSPMIRHLVENMTEEHWRVVREALHVSRTKEDVSQLCSCIVAKVVRTTHYYLIPALRKVLGVPVTYVIPCGTARVSTSDAKKARELSLGQGNLRAEHAKASGLSLSIPLLDQLTGAEFRGRVTEQVSEVLLSTLGSDSCPESPAEVFAKDDHESNTIAERQTDIGELPAFYPSGTHSQSVADDLVDDLVDDFVDDVIDSMNEDLGQNALSAAVR
ncbi:uncharacterized protein LOC134069691 [Sardina pilchardus]|uniref:uncharacterized protein LOC134069691 n=1 Tax=Sardina pilchardus TaxID=27697 RepID=UPI002E0D3003